MCFIKHLGTTTGTKMKNISIELLILILEMMARICFVTPFWDGNYQHCIWTQPARMRIFLLAKEINFSHHCWLSLF